MGRGENAFVKVIQIKIGEAVFTFVGAKIFEMQITAQPSSGRAAQEISGRKVFIKQVAGAAQKRKRIVRNGPIFSCQPLRVATLVEFSDTFDDIRFIAHVH